jgi:hypothetical protein
VSHLVVKKMKKKIIMEEKEKENLDSSVLGTIEIIRDTLWWEEGPKKCLRLVNFFCFVEHCFNALGNKSHA